MDRVVDLLYSKDRNTRHEAIEILGERGDKSAIPHLLPLLRDGDCGIRDAVINSLVRIGGTEVAREVVPFLYDKDVAVRNAAVEILERLGNDSIPFLLPLLEGKDEDVLKFAIDIIGNIGNRQLSYVLIPFLSHSNPNIRAAAATALGNLRVYEAIGNIVAMALEEREEWVRFAALEALGRIGSPDLVDRLISLVDEGSISKAAVLDALSNLVRPEDWRKVIPLLKDTSHLLSTDTVVGFVERFRDEIDDSGKKVLLDILKRRLDREEVDEVREVLRGMAMLRDPRATKPLIRYLQKVREDDGETKALVKEALVASGRSGEIVEALGRTKRNLDVLVRALGEIGDPSAVEALESLFAKADRDTKRVIMESLERVGASSTDTAIQGLSDEDGHVRRSSARLLGRIGDEGAMERLYQALLKEPYEDVREAIVEALSSFGDRAVGYMERLLSHRDPSLRRFAVKGLKELSSREIRAYLEEALKDHSPEVRKEAVSIIPSMDDPVSLLEGPIHDVDRRVRLEAVKVLGEIEGGMDLLLEALKDEDIWVRYKAVEAIGRKVRDTSCAEMIGEVEGALITLLLQDEIPVKVMCASVLGAIGTERALSVLEGFVDHQDPYLAKAARESLWRNQSCQKRPSQP